MKTKKISANVYSAQEFVWMIIALEAAKVAHSMNEVPVGAVVVGPDDICLGVGFNKIEQLNCQIGHAEAEAISLACLKLNSWHLESCTIFITLEPCLMCFGLIRMSRIKKIVYAAPSKLFGYTNFIDKAIAFKSLLIKSGLKQDDSIGMLKEFFRRARLAERKSYEKRS